MNRQELNLSSRDQTCHREVWMHLDHVSTLVVERSRESRHHKRDLSRQPTANHELDFFFDRNMIVSHQETGADPVRITQQEVVARHLSATTGGSKRHGARGGEYPGAPALPRQSGRPPYVWRHFLNHPSSDQSDEFHRFVAPSATSLDRHNHQPAFP